MYLFNYKYFSVFCDFVSHNLDRMLRIVWKSVKFELYYSILFGNMYFMKNFIRLSGLVVFMAVMFCAEAFALNGGWRGELALGEMRIPLVFNFVENGAGETSCTMDSPSQGAKGIPVTVVLCTSDSISLECNSIGARFNGNISKETIEGKFVQHGFTFPMTLKPDAPLQERRPQTPQPPYPYIVKDTVFMAPDGVALSGTISMPVLEKNQTVPAVVMVTGSGPQNRDEEMLDHKPFAVIADYLARNGVASLRYDDRGTGKSKGDFVKSTTYTFKDDAKSGIEFMRMVPGIGKTGVLGHSEGGTIAFMLGAENVPDFIISLAGLAVPGKDGLVAQNARSLDKSGITGKDKENSLALISCLFDEMAEQGKAGISTPIDPDSLAKAHGIVVPQEVLSTLKSTQKIRTSWFDILLGIDPEEDIASIKCPLLAINGDKDTQVEAEPNLAVIKKNCPKAEIRMMPSLNHLMQHAQTGDMAEYNEIRETISPEVLEIILEFIKRSK